MPLKSAASSRRSCSAYSCHHCGKAQLSGYVSFAGGQRSPAKAAGQRAPGPFGVDDAAQPLQAQAAQPAQPPPPTETGTQEVAGVTVVTKADAESGGPAGGAKTNFQLAHSAVPGYDHQGGRITAISGPMPKLTMTIQTRYGAGAQAKDRSGYGRGTTDADKAAGNISLGFHEHCHQEDYLRYLRGHAAPTFTGAVGMLVSEYEAAVRAFRKAVQDYTQAMDDYSEEQTDQVGTLP